MKTDEVIKWVLKIKCSFSVSSARETLERRVFVLKRIRQTLVVCCVKQSVPHRRTSRVMNVCRNAMRQENLHFILQHQEGNKFYAIFCCSSNVDLFHRENCNPFYPFGCTNFFNQTRMHSSRMHTARISCRLGGRCLPMGGVCPGGCLPRGCTPPCEQITDRCKNITFPQLHFRVVISIKRHFCRPF